MEPEVEKFDTELFSAKPSSLFTKIFLIRTKLHEYVNFNDLKPPPKVNLAKKKRYLHKIFY